MTIVPFLGTIEPNMGTIRQDESISMALFGKARRAVLGLLLTHPDESFYLRQIVRAAGVGQGAVQREVRSLAEAGVLERFQVGRQVHYRANRDCPVHEELHSLMVKTAGVAEVVRGALSELADRIEVAFIYGSFATGEATAESDVDLMVVGTMSFSGVVEAIQSAQGVLAREINPAVYPPGEFRDKLQKNHHFLTRVMEGPKIWILGDEDELGRLVEEPLAKGT